MLSDSPQMMNAKRASDIMNRMYNSGTGVVAPTPAELEFLKTFQNRKIGP
jgi:ATP-dependent Clp protease adapter protein ClpS